MDWVSSSMVRGSRIYGLISIVLVAGLLAACGGGETTTVTVAPAETTQATTEEMTTEATTEAAADTAAFDAAAAQAVEATNALLALRAECLATNNVGACLTDREGEFTAAEATLSTALNDAGTAATAAGADPDWCQGAIEGLPSRIEVERTGLAGRDATSIDDFSAFNGPLTDGNAAYFDTLRQRLAGDPGYVVGLVLGDCRLNLGGDAPNAELLDKTLTFAFNSLRTQSEIGFVAWGVKLCLHRVDAAATLFCLQQIAPAGDFSELRATLAEYVQKLNGGYEGMTAAPGYAELSSTCKSAFEASHADLEANAAKLEDLYAKITDAELGKTGLGNEEAGNVVYDEAGVITDTTAATRTQPLDGTTMLMCIEEVAAQG